MVNSSWRNASECRWSVQRSCAHSLTARGIEQAQNLHTLLHGVSFDLVLCSELERAQHTARRVLSDRQLPVQIIPELNEMFFGDWEMRHHRDLMQEDAENYSAWCNDWQHAIPRTVKDFRHFHNVWNGLSQGLVNFSTIRIF